MYVNQRQNVGEHDLIAKESYFRMIFNTRFNIGFRSPRSDVCSKCLELTERIKTEIDLTKQNGLKAEKRIHKLRAAAFFEYLQENDETLKIISFDCQKNQVLPKVPDQSAYYSRQFYIYNFTIVDGHSRSPLTRDNVSAFTWTENEYSKSVRVFHYLTNHINLAGVTKLRLMADGCGGQNKNFILLGMVMKWFRDHSPKTLKTCKIIYPVPGHSFIPPDRVFSAIDGKIKKEN